MTEVSPFEAALMEFEEAVTAYNYNLGRNPSPEGDKASRERWDRLSKARRALLEFDPAKPNK